jgi:hypothetical protein
MRVSLKVFCASGIFATVVALPVTTGWCSAAKGKHPGVKVEERKSADDHVTEGWVLTYDNPEPERAWDRIPGTLVVAQHGKVIRRWELRVIRNWGFWEGGREVVIQVGGMHGPTSCSLYSVQTGKVMGESEHCDYDDTPLPDWAKALDQ